jgi:membrane associated rhomboid family serine protease
MTGAVGPVANIAHVVGLVVGMTVAYVPAFWRR